MNQDKSDLESLSKMIRRSRGMSATAELLVQLFDINNILIAYRFTK